MKKTLIIVAVWLAVANLFAFFVLNRLNLNADTAYRWINPNEFHQDKSDGLVALHDHWDSAWFLDVVKNGYSYNGAGKPSNIVFFPMYPLLISAVSVLPGISDALAGWLVSLVFLGLAAAYLAKLVKEFHPQAEADTAIAFLLAFPTAFFLNAIYSESVFLFFTVAAVYYGRRGDWRWAGLAGFAAGLTRITGLLLAIPLAWELLRQSGWKKIWRAETLAAFMPALGTAAFFGYHWARFGSPDIFFIAQKWWGRGFALTAEHFDFRYSEAALMNFSQDIGFVALAVVATAFVAKRVRASYAAYVAATALVALSTGTMMSIGRYLLALFPIFIAAAAIKQPLVRNGLLFASSLFLALNIALFVNDYWAG